MVSEARERSRGVFGKTNKSLPAVVENDDVMRIVSYDDLLAGDVFVG